MEVGFKSHKHVFFLVLAPALLSLLWSCGSSSPNSDTKNANTTPTNVPRGPGAMATGNTSTPAQAVEVELQAPTAPTAYYYDSNLSAEQNQTLEIAYLEALVVYRGQLDAYHTQRANNVIAADRAAMCEPAEVVCAEE